ncbi:MAG: HAMP domain-containing protein [Candidatus Aminicenantes bacterium]|nr:HAMP domain-containing protein [Candidatus Aminicenantes bacterium]
MKNKGLFLKIFFGFGALILLLAALTVLFSFSVIRTHYDNRMAAELEHLGRALSSNVLALLDGPADRLEAFLVEESRQTQARITIIDPDGVVLAESSRDPSSMESHRYRPEVAQALEGKVGQSKRWSYTVEDRMMYVGIPLENPDGSVKAVLRFSLYTRDVEALLSEIRGGLLRAVLIVTGLALLAALFIALHLTRPIKILVRASEKVAGGDFKSKVHVARRDEFKTLADGFNFMTERLDSLFEALAHRKEEVDSVIGAIREGLAVIDSEGRIVLANDAFRATCPTVSLEGTFYWEVIRSGALLELLARVRRNKVSQSAELKIGERQVLAAVSHLPAQDGMALILHDLTRQRQVENIKRDFIVNASHELRTPLSAIAGAVELLQDDRRANDPMALDILRRHVIRMRAIIEDLLKLGELENPEIRLDFGDLDAETLAARVLELYHDRAEQKGLRLSLRKASDLPLVRADAFLIEQALINLIDNAVKYTDKGAISVEIKPESGFLVIDVADTGPGISESHRERVFERFYRVDKSRSRILGGTGLGLSIVKHIVQLHGGTIAVRGEEGKGSVFSIRLPLDRPDEG